MDLMNQHFLWASCIWSAVASGYCIYGWRQKATIPLVSGAAMTAASFFFAALPMTAACVVILVVTHWLLRHGY